MLYAIAAICVAGWLLCMALSVTLGGLIHLLLVVAADAALIGILHSRRVERMRVHLRARLRQSECTPERRLKPRAASNSEGRHAAPLFRPTSR